MDFLKSKIPLSVVVAALGIAATSGGSAAVASSKITANTARLDKVERERQEDRELLIEMRTILQRIERKVGP